MKRKGISPVIASIILSATVLVVGTGVWSYSYGASSMMANDYSETTIDMVHTISERFCVEKVHYDNTTEYVHVWLYNYGNIVISVDTTVKINGSSYYEPEITIISKEIKKVSIDVTAEPVLVENDVFTVEILTARDNTEKITYYVP